MKQKTAPTSPKKNPSRNPELEDIYREGMDHLNKPQKKSFGLGNAVFFLLISVLSGIVGAIFFLSQNDRFGLISVSQPENQIIIRDGAKAYQQQEEFKRTLVEKAELTVLRIFAHEINQDPEVVQDMLFTEEEFAGFGFLLTSDGKAFTSASVLDPEKTYVAVNWNNEYQEIKTILRDETSGLAFFTFPGSSLQVVDIAETGSTFPIEKVYILDKRLTTPKFSMSEHTLVQQTQEQYLFADSFIASSEQYFPVVTISDIAEYPKGAPVYRGDGTLIGFFSGNKDNPTVTYLPERRVIIDQYLLNNKIAYPTLGLHGIDVSRVPYISNAFAYNRTDGFLLVSSTDGTVEAVVEGSPADVAGLQVGDLIIQVGGLSITKERTIGQALLEGDSDAEVTVKYIRDNEENSISIPLNSAQ